MTYQELTSYKLLLALGCTETTGPIMKKKGIVKLTLPSTGAQNQAYFHFDPAYKVGDKIVAKAARIQASSSTDFFIKEPGNNDCDLAFSAFILSMLKIQKVTPFSQKAFNEAINKNRLKIFNKIFSGEK